jgi:hypothetical protein
VLREAAPVPERALTTDVQTSSAIKPVLQPVAKPVPLHEDHQLGEAGCQRSQLFGILALESKQGIVYLAGSSRSQERRSVDFGL